MADTGPAEFLTHPRRLTDQRTLLATSAQFVLEHIKLASNFIWEMDAERETWFLVLSGNARAGLLEVAAGEVVFAQSDHIKVHAGEHGMTGLVARAGIDPAETNEPRGTIQ